MEPVLSFGVGTDVGGTFTDLWVLASDGRQRVLKSPTTRDVVTGVLEAVALAAASYDVGVEEFCAGIERVGHGTTVGLNALLTGTAARTAVVTTEGSGDILEIGRLKRGVSGLAEHELGDYLRRGASPPLVPRERGR